MSSPTPPGKPHNDNGRFPDFRKTFPMDMNLRSNQVQYLIRTHRELMSNWLKMFGVPALLLKLKKEAGRPLDNNDFSDVDKLVIAYGKSGIAFDENPTAYEVFQVYLPIENTSYNKLSNKFTETLAFIVPVDDRFTYSMADMVVFRENNTIFRYEIAMEPSEYLGITVELALKLVDAHEIVSDKNHKDPDQKTIDESEFW